MMVAMSPAPTRVGQLPARAKLPDGTSIVVRELYPSDEPALRAWFATVSDTSRYLRFHSHLSDLSPALWLRNSRDGERRNRGIVNAETAAS